MDSKYTVKYTARAETDYWQILDEIISSDRYPANKIRLMRDLTNKINSLEFMPHRYRIYEDIVDFGELRTFVVDNYRVLYTINNAAMVVTVVRIVYSRANNKQL